MIQDDNIDKIIKQLPNASLDRLSEMYKNYCYMRDFMGVSVPQQLLTALLKEIENKRKPSLAKLTGKAAEVQEQEEMREAAWEEKKKELAKNPIDEKERLRDLLHQAEAKNYDMGKQQEDERLFFDARRHDDLKEAVQKGLDKRRDTQQAEPSKEPVVADCLNTREAKKYWKRLQKAGYVDEHWQRTKKCSRRMSTVIAKKMAGALNIKACWKPFEQLWGLKNLAQDYSKIIDPSELYEEVDEIFYD